MDSIPLWIVFVICIVGGAYFAATESSFSAVNKIKIKTLADDGNKRARGVLWVVNRFDKALTTLLVGNNVTKIAAASVATLIATQMFAHKGENFINSFAFSIMCSAASTAVVFLFSEMIPKSFANDRSESVSLFFQGSLRFLMRVLSPIAGFFGLISTAASKAFSKGEAEPSITEDELIEIIDTVEEEGVVDEEQSDMLKSALEFGDTVVGDIMTMTRDIEALNVSASTEEVLDVIRAANHSRIPVYAGDINRIIGTLRIRTFLTEYRRNPKVKVRGLLSQPHFVSEDTKIGEILTDMRQHKHHIVLVRDKNKKIVGLATIEDILEELVGEIFDEEDVVDKDFQALGGNRYLVNTHMLMGDLYARIGLSDAPKHLCAKPLLSLMLETLGRLPEVEESFLIDDLEFTVETVENQRPVRAFVHVLDEEDLAALAAKSTEEEVQA
ncbi:MAG: HlyC/CorC family transporter [Ruminococcaceae bacterium]|nr:HlyC/CorC family transporter [Oscillospiraceae bacterium]